VSLEEKAKIEVKQLMAEIGKLQTQSSARQAQAKNHISQLIKEINSLQVVAAKEHDKEKAKLAKQETKKLFETQLSHFILEQQSLRVQLEKLAKTLEQYELLKKNTTGGLSAEDQKRQQQIQQLIAKKKSDFVQFQKEAESIRQKATQRGISLEDEVVAETEVQLSSADMAKAEVEKLIREVAQPHSASLRQKTDALEKSSEVNKLIAEIAQLQATADQGLLTEEEARQLEDRIKRIEGKQKKTRDQINQLTQAKIKFELALMRSQEQKETLLRQKEQDIKLQEQLNQLISTKEEEQQQLMEELNLIRLRAEQEAAVLKAQRDAAMVMAGQSVDRLGNYHPSRSYRWVSFLLIFISIVIASLGIFLMTPYSRILLAQYLPNAKVLGQQSTQTASPGKSTAKDKMREDTLPSKEEALDIKPATALGSFKDRLNTGGTGPAMVKIAGNTFWMGGSATPEESPKHPVTLESFAISKYEITFAEFQRFARETSRAVPEDNGWGKGNRPIINVSWQDTQAYTEWLTSVSGYQYRLPSEREWEYAATAGTATPYWWGSDANEGKANCQGCGSEFDGRLTAPVGSFLANPLGVHDMIGNVMEWTQGCYHPRYQGAPRLGQIWEGGNCTLRVARGGAYNTPAKDARSASRQKFQPDTVAPWLGFRVVRVL